jgi:hypothetical protein
MKSESVNRLAACLAVSFLAVPAAAQWSTDPGANLVLSDRSGEQVQPKVAATGDGGAYVSWFDNSDGGYDVYLQRLDGGGVEQWAHNGVLVADRGFSSTQDYGLAVDTAGNALLAYRDDQGSFEQISAAKVSPDGTLLWDVQLTSVPDFIAAPRIAGTTDGDVVVAWTQDVNTVVQKLDSNGAALWGAGVTIPPSGSFLSASDLQAGDAGTAIVSMVHSVTGGGPRHIWAQKLASADGAPLWGADPLPIYDAAAGSLQFGSFPAFVHDGSGGGVFSWYTSSPSLQCRAQRVSSAGVELFAHNGVETSTNATRLRVSPAASFAAASQETFIFWVESNAGQSQFGVYGQKLDAAGTRQWTDAGKELVALGSSQISFIQNAVLADGALVTWIDSLTFGDDPIRGTRVDTNGDFVWIPPLTDLATDPTSSSRLAGTLSSTGFGIYAWSDGATGAADILAQNLNPDGSLGPGSIFADGFESGDTSAWSIAVP